MMRKIFVPLFFLFMFVPIGRAAGSYSNNAIVEKVYHDNGRLKSIGEVKNGKREGVFKWYYESGNLWEVKEYKNDRWIDNGKPFEGNHKIYYESGEMYADVNFTRGKLSGVFKKYHKNGGIKVDGNYKDGHPVGVFKEYDESGRITLIQTFTDEGVKIDEKAY